jgi:hypothetical protein
MYCLQFFLKVVSEHHNCVIPRNYLLNSRLLVFSIVQYEHGVANLGLSRFSIITILHGHEKMDGYWIFVYRHQGNSYDLNKIFYQDTKIMIKLLLSEPF